MKVDHVVLAIESFLREARHYDGRGNEEPQHNSCQPHDHCSVGAHHCRVVMGFNHSHEPVHGDAEEHDITHSHIGKCSTCEAMT